MPIKYLIILAIAVFSFVIYLIYIEEKERAEKVWKEETFENIPEPNSAYVKCENDGRELCFKKYLDENSTSFAPEKVHRCLIATSMDCSLKYK